jgi:hypothetical protein
MARLILEDVTLKRDQTLITVQVRFKGGATKVLSLPIPPTVGELRKTKAVIVAEIDRLLERCTDSEVAAELNKKGWRSSTNQPFSRWIIYQLRTGHKLASRTERLRARGFLNAREVAPLVGTKPLLVDYWRQQGLLEGIRLNDKNGIFTNLRMRTPSNKLNNAQEAKTLTIHDLFWIVPMRRSMKPTPSSGLSRVGHPCPVASELAHRCPSSA